MKNSICTCPFCLKGNYDPADYSVDISTFKRERPVGVSGLMRVKNEARWIEQSIDTCINALDELIICYQPCSDETPEIIERKRLQYPDKIKVFFYAPPLYAFELSRKDFDYACSLPKDSIHHFSNYTNYILSKASYRYAMKIDADQIYFSKRISDLCDAYRGFTRKRKAISTGLAFGYYRLFIGLGKRYPSIFFRITDFIPFKGQVMEKYWDYLCTQIVQTKKPVSLSGINLYKGRNGWAIPALTNSDDYLLPFNGVGDLEIFAVSDQSYFYPCYQTMKIEEVTEMILFNPMYTSRRVIEVFHREGSTALYAGFCWYHMKFVNQKYAAGHPLFEKIDFKSFFSFSLSELINRKLLNISQFRYMPHWYSFVYDKKIPNPDDLLSKLFFNSN